MSFCVISFAKLSWLCEIFRIIPGIVPGHNSFLSFIDLRIRTFSLLFVPGQDGRMEIIMFKYSTKSILFKTIFCNLLLGIITLVMLLANTLYYKATVKNELKNSIKKELVSTMEGFLSETDKIDKINNSFSGVFAGLKKEPSVQKLNELSDFIQTIEQSFPYTVKLHVLADEDTLISSNGVSNRESLYLAYKSQYYFDDEIPRFKDIKTGINSCGSFFLYKTSEVLGICTYADIPKASFERYLCDSSQSENLMYTITGDDGNIIDFKGKNFKNQKGVGKIRIDNKVKDRAVSFEVRYDGKVYSNEIKMSMYSIAVAILFILLNLLVIIYQFVLHYPVFNFARKLTDSDEFKENEFEVINKAVLNLKRSNLKMRERITSAEEIKRLDILTSLITHCNDEDFFEENAEFIKSFSGEFGDIYFVTVLSDENNNKIISDIEECLNNKSQYRIVSVKFGCSVVLVTERDDIKRIYATAAANRWGDYGICCISGKTYNVRTLNDAYIECIGNIYGASADAILHSAVVDENTKSTSEKTDITHKAYSLIGMVVCGNVEKTNEMVSDIFDSMKNISYRSFRYNAEYMMHIYNTVLNSKNLTDYVEDDLNIGELYSVKTISAHIAEKFIGLAELFSEDSGDLLRNVMDYIERNIEGDLSLAVIADKFHITVEYLSSYFKKKAGANLSAYITEQRMKNAVKILKENPNIKIAELSERCGYENVNTFTRQFKQYTGTTPSKYKTFFNGEV